VSTPQSAIQRVYVEKNAGFDVEAQNLITELVEFLGITYGELHRGLTGRILHRYDVAHLDEEQFDRACKYVLSEAQSDRVYRSVPVPAKGGEQFFAVEYLQGQYDQRADSAEQCIELVCGVRPIVRCARVYLFQLPGTGLSEKALGAIKDYLINPVDSREAELGLPESLDPPTFQTRSVPRVEGLIDQNEGDLKKTLGELGLAMDLEDLRFCQAYFRSCQRDPTLAELRVLDTYWSDHCRHTTFTTELVSIEFDDFAETPALRRAMDLYLRSRQEVYGEGDGKDHPITLMDLATIGSRVLKKRGLAADVEESKEINACSIRCTLEFDDGSTEPWLLMFKNETHNHPTEIEPFGGAATCLGGAIRDPLSGRSYVYQAMRVSGGGDPRKPITSTLKGKLPQIKIAREAAAGYSSYGNQIGLATGQVAELYHDGFVAKRMELGAVIGAVNETWVRREEPQQGDVILLVGGKTGRDGIGGATGSSKVHTEGSVQSAGAEVQKGNAVEERKIQRLFRNPHLSRLIKRCNDFGAGGVSVAVGELAGGLDIDLDAVPKKYADLDGIELAISESQERMAVVVAPEDVDAFIAFAAEENLTAVPIALVTHQGDSPSARLRMTWQGDTIVDLARSFLDSNGAPRTAAAKITGAENGVPFPVPPRTPSAILDDLERELRSLRTTSRRGLQERFDGSIGAGSVLYPWAGAEQGTPECGMVALLPSLEKEARTASIMTFGYDPEVATLSPYRGAKGAIREALAKFACLGGNPWTARLSLQEYFEKPDSPSSWGKPLQALLGALEAQLALGVPAIGGKDSMSGSYVDPEQGIQLKVPPTLVAFAAGTAPVKGIRSSALSGEVGNPLVLLYLLPQDDEWQTFKANLNTLQTLSARGLALSATPVIPGGLGATLAIAAFGNMVGLEVEAEALSLIPPTFHQGSIVVELDGKSFQDSSLLASAAHYAMVGRTIAEPVFRIRGEAVSDPTQNETPLVVLRRSYEYGLVSVYSQTSHGITILDDAYAESSNPRSIPSTEKSLPPFPLWKKGSDPKPISPIPLLRGAKPLVVLPVFPGTNCEWDMKRAFEKAGGRTQFVIYRNRDRQDILESTRELQRAIQSAQIVALSGGFSAGDEPDGSGKFIANALRAPSVADAVTALLDSRSGLILGICNGFQALIKLGLVPFGTFREPSPEQPTLTFNAIARHSSRMVRTKVLSNLSPWLALEEPGTVHILPISHGEGRIVLTDTDAQSLFKQGQVPFCYVDPQGNPTMAEPHNPNGSAFAIEGLTSPDGRILGKMAHSEREGPFVHINIPGNKKQHIFEAGLRYFQ